MKLMAKKNTTSGLITDVKYYVPSEYEGAVDLVELLAWPTMSAPWCYDENTKLAVAAQSLVSLSASSATLSPDGVSIQQVTIIGPAGSTVTATFAGAVPIDALSYVLDGNGQATITFGPTTMRTATPIRLSFNLQDGSSPADAVLSLSLQ